MTRVYVCTPLAHPKFDLKSISEVILCRGVFAFIPPVGQLNDKSTGAKLDKLMIDMCEEVYVFGNIGRDCSWEIGYATGKGIPVKIFINSSNMDILEDWMTTINVEIIYIKDSNE